MKTPPDTPARPRPASERDIRPTVLVIGGFLTSPPLYWRLRRRLLARGAAAVVLAPIWTPDWLLAARLGLGPIVTRAGRALLRASAIADAASAGAPVLVVGHSAGGMVARILTAPEPFAGRHLNGSRRIGALVTLGTPHVVGAHAGPGGHVPADVERFVNRVVPGSFFEPIVAYLTIASRAVVGRPAGAGRDRAVYRMYRGLLPDSTPDAPEIPGDGLIPLACALLPGARHLVFDDAMHGQESGRPWYGSAEFVDRWWPLALAAWRDALVARG